MDCSIFHTQLFGSSPCSLRKEISYTFPVSYHPQELGNPVYIVIVDLVVYFAGLIRLDCEGGGVARGYGVYPQAVADVV